MARRNAFVLTILLGGYSAAAKAASCVYVPSAESPAVTACEEDVGYRFEVTGTSFTYPKAAYQSRLNALLSDWLAGAGLAAPENATIELWLAVPEADPSAAQARAVLRSPALNLVWYLSLHPEEWTLQDRDLGILEGGAAYPQSFGHRPGDLLVKAKGGSDAARAALLAGYGATEPAPYVSGWSIYRTAAAAELAVAADVLADPRAPALIDAVEVNHVVEWIAARQLAFTFAFSQGSP